MKSAVDRTATNLGDKATITLDVEPFDLEQTLDGGQAFRPLGVACVARQVAEIHLVEDEAGRAGLRAGRRRAGPGRRLRGHGRHQQHERDTDESHDGGSPHMTASNLTVPYRKTLKR